MNNRQLRKRKNQRRAVAINALEELVARNCSATGANSREGVVNNNGVVLGRSNLIGLLSKVTDE